MSLRRTLPVNIALAVAAVAYVAFIAAGIWQLPRQSSYWAAGEFVAGHRMTERDLASESDADSAECRSPSMQSIVGRYLVHDLQRGQCIAESDLLEQPHIAVTAGYVAYSAPLDGNAAFRSAVDAGGRLTLCWAEQCLGNLSVLAVTCAVPPATQCDKSADDDSCKCRAVVELSAADASKTSDMDHFRVLINGALSETVSAAASP